MSSVPATFSALVAERDGDRVLREVRQLTVDDLGDGGVVIKVEWSGVNYKDGLASIPNGKVARIDPIIPGVDLAGVIVEPGDSALDVGTPVIVHGYDTGVAHHGGFSEYARVPASWIVPLPDGLTTRQAMVIGTAGFTAALSVHALEKHGLTTGAGPVLVTGATGGVGSVAVGILAERGYEVTASSGKREAEGFLKELGATEVLPREETSGPGKPLERERWAGAVDCVGASSLPYILRTLKYGAAVAASGNTGGIALETTVFPFILRGVALLGIDSVAMPIDQRREVWQRIATDLRPRGLDSIGSREVTLTELPDALDAVLAGANTGRTLVRL
ncbi:MAG TPA: oxidoreductase [Actinomycetes bacterium]|nr:oxidoreductase [Actinomycetes bacterium]